MKNTMTNEQAWNWLGNRGISVYKHNVRVRGIWAFVRYPDWEDVDYYHLDANGSAEPMDSIRLDDSPFAANSKDKVAATVERITEQFYKDYPEELTGSCLVAISGDCAAGGLGPDNDVLPFDDKHQALVLDFLRAQFEFYSYHHFNATQSPPILYTKFHDAFLALKDADVFKHKWHFRTEWELAYMNEIEDTKRFHPYRIVKEEVK
tara:strand:+ start:639 stop:1256 length:618 start_codon:yes stop_codon:yes gene_type:complete